MMSRKSSMIFSLSFLSLLTLPQSHSFSFVEPLYEGSSCALEQGGTGICKQITDCPSRLRQVRLGQRNQLSKDRCGFSGFTEIVCCPLQDLSQKIGIRLADLACRQYENEVAPDEDLVFHIIGGEEAGTGEFPFMAALGYRVTDEDDEDDEDNKNKTTVKYNCGGTLISQQHVLTAAHCVNNIEGRIPFQVRFGSNDLSDLSDVQRIAVEEVISHPDYRRSLVYNDVAIIRLKKPVQITRSVKPICLPTTPVTRTLMRLGGNASFIVIGWGATGFGEKSSQTLLKTPPMSLIESKNCASFYKGFRRLSRGFDSAMICAMDTSETEGHADACQGDSGGPLLMITNNDQQTVVGVTSFGQICGTSVPAVYMNVYSYIDWIESIVWPDNSDNN